VDEYRREPHSSGRPWQPRAIDNTASARRQEKKPPRLGEPGVTTH
jgi:hypothetical protein